MAIRLTFLCAGATASSRKGAFPTPEEPLDAGGLRKATAFRVRGGHDCAVSSPSRAARESAAAIGLAAATEDALADQQSGEWTGRTLADVERTDPAELAAWLADPTRAAPGGESLASLAGRVGGWIDRCAGSGGSVLAVTHAAVMRAAIAHCLGVPLAAVTRIDIAPLATLELSFHRQWRLQELRRPR